MITGPIILLDLTLPSQTFPLPLISPRRVLLPGNTQEAMLYTLQLLLNVGSIIVKI